MARPDQAVPRSAADGLPPDEPDLQPGRAAVQQLAQFASEAADYSVSQPLAVEDTTLGADETYLRNVLLFTVE